MDPGVPCCAMKANPTGYLWCKYECFRTSGCQNMDFEIDNMCPFSKTKVHPYHRSTIPGRVAQSVTCLATDACLTADPGVASSIPARYHTFVEIDHEIISTVILLPSTDLFKKGCCQLQAKVCAQITG